MCLVTRAQQRHGAPLAVRVEVFKALDCLAAGTALGCSGSPATLRQVLQTTGNAL